MRCNLTIDHGCPMLSHCKDASPPPSIRHAITPMLVYQLYQSKQSKQSKQSTHDRILWPLACPFSSCFSSHSHGTLRAKTSRTGWRSSAAIRIALRYLYDSSVSVESCFEALLLRHSHRFADCFALLTCVITLFSLTLILWGLLDLRLHVGKRRGSLQDYAYIRYTGFTDYRFRYY